MSRNDAVLCAKMAATAVGKGLVFLLFFLIFFLLGMVSPLENGAKSLPKIIPEFLQLSYDLSDDCLPTIVTIFARASNFHSCKGVPSPTA